MKSDIRSGAGVRPLGPFSPKYRSGIQLYLPPGKPFFAIVGLVEHKKRVDADIGLIQEFDQ